MLNQIEMIVGEEVELTERGAGIRLLNGVNH